MGAGRSQSAVVDPVPNSMMAAIACSAAAGKNPWLPMGLLLLLAAPTEVPALLMDPGLHLALHGLAPAEVLYGFGSFFLALGCLESVADKLPWVERWLVPVSTTWRPFAAVAVAFVIAYAAAEAVSVTPEADALAAGPLVLTAGPTWASASLMTVTVALGLLFGWLSTVGKTGTRLVLSLVPLPGLRLAHSFLDDLFAIGATVAGFVLGDSVILMLIAALYLLIGLFLGPVLFRLTRIHLRIGAATFSKGLSHLFRMPPRVATTPRWVLRHVEAAGLSIDASGILPAYGYRIPTLGWVRDGHVLLLPNRIVFITRVWFRPRSLDVPRERLGRLGLSATMTGRSVAIVERAPGGGLRQTLLHLFPALEAESATRLADAANGAGLCRVRVSSESARRMVPGYGQRTDSERFVQESEAGSLRLQSMVTIAAALGVGLLTGGVIVPIGTGYILSPFKLRFGLAMAVTAYLSLCVLGTLGLGWPAAVLYAVLLNALALRDLTRAAIKARVDGFVDRQEWLPVVCGRVWIAPELLVDEGDRLAADAEDGGIAEGTLRSVLRSLASDDMAEASGSAERNGVKAGMPG